MDAAIIEKEALLLPDHQRALLADRILESLTPASSELQTAWLRELDSRMEAFHQGRIAAVDGPSTIAEFKARYGQ